MTELEDIFVELGLSQYLDTFVEQGFDTWDTILDITESDFDALGVKLGHRRKLQRKIANSRGVSSDQALKSLARDTSVDDRQLDENRTNVSKADARESVQPASGKRKYRRHPKSDENAPERPPSAYVIFSNKMRVDLKGRHLSFTEIAKLVGENWQNLSVTEKEPFEAQAFAAKEKYNAHLAEYKRTENYRKYMEYLVEFKEKQANHHNATDASKRPKLEHQVSTGSSGAGSSAGSQQGPDGTAGSVRGESTGSATTSRFSSGGGHSPLNRPYAIPSKQPNHGGVTLARDQTSPTVPTSGILPGYRDAMYNSNYQQTLAWRENTRGPDSSSSAHFARITNMADRRSGQAAISPYDPSSQFGPRSQNESRTSRKFSPPALLTSESTAGTTISSTSNNSSIQYMPRTPLEPSLDRPLMIPSIYPSKPYENQLPPLRSISLSPQISINVSYNSPAAIAAMDYPLSSSRHGYQPASQSQITSPMVVEQTTRLPSLNIGNDEVLDPVSALLKADEIVNRNSRNYPPS